MRRTHIPVLAGELIDLLDPQPRPDRDRLHLRRRRPRRADRRAPRARGHLHRDRPRSARRGALRGTGRRGRLLGALHPRELRRGARAARRRGGARPTSPTSISACPRCRWTRASAASPTPSRRRWTCGWTPSRSSSAREIVAEWDERRLARALRDFGEERHAGAIARAIVRRRAEAPIETTVELVDTINSAIPAPARFAGGHPAKRSFQALRIAVNDELGQLDRGLPLAWELLREGGVLAGISFHSLEDRRVKRFLTERARGCICPPEMPVCGCGREAEAALLARRAIMPSAGEVAHNPRAGSARLRAARKLPRVRRVGMTRSPDSGRRLRWRPPDKHATNGGSGMTPPAAAAAAAPAIAPRRTASPRRAPATAQAAARLRPRQPARGGRDRSARADARVVRAGAAVGLAEAVATHRLLDRLIRGRAVDRGDRVRADRDRDDAAGAAEAERRDRPLARARSAVAARERDVEHRKLRSGRRRTGRSAGRARGHGTDPAGGAALPGRASARAMSARPRRR